jgi:hypothetical protein
MSSVFENLAKEMGAKCCSHFSKAVTVVVTDQTKLSKIIDRARENGIMCVSILWLAECKEQRKRLDYEAYQVKESFKGMNLHVKV